MRVSYGEGLASHSGPESCVCIRKGVGEALTGGAASRDIEPRKSHRDRDASAVHWSEGQYQGNRKWRGCSGPAWSKTPCARSSLSCGNREILEPGREEMATRSATRTLRGHDVDERFQEVGQLRST